MEDVVPGALQRLREADIVGLAGLASASLGQEYCRAGRVSELQRQGGRLSGVVTLPETQAEERQEEARVEVLEADVHAEQQWAVAVEMQSPTSCTATCACGKPQKPFICSHAAALLYQWVIHPSTFLSVPQVHTSTAEPPVESPIEEPASPTPMSRDMPETSRPFIPPVASKYAPLPSRHQEVNTISETLEQFGLSELRALAREYNVAQAGLSKQQLLEMMIETLHQPEAIRRVVSALEKPQRQLLAAFALAGGSMSDEDLRGLFERFSLGSSSSLQDMLVVLQARLLIVRTSFNHSLQPRFHSSLSTLDVNWYIPQEVREALHVALPVTPFNVEVPYGKGEHPPLPMLELAPPWTLLADLLLVARALESLPPEQTEKRGQRGGSLLASRAQSDGSLALPPPEDQPGVAMIEGVGSLVPRLPAFLRFGVRLLHLGNLLYKEENWPSGWRVNEGAALSLLGPTHQDLLHELFRRWAQQPSYAELYELSEHGVRVRCRSTPLNQPDLRRGELEQENSEARQDLLALLAQVPVGEWINFAAFARFIYRLRPTFLQRRQRLFPSPHWWIEQEEGRPLHPTQLTDWMRAEGRFLAYLLQGPLHWWGISDLALAPNGQLLAFRLTLLADFLLRGQEQALPAESPIAPASSVLTVSPTGDILITCQTASWPLISCLERFAEIQGVQDEKLHYVLSARSLSMAIGQGRDSDELLALLTDAASKDEEDRVRQLLKSLERRIANYGRVRIYTDASLLQTADISVMQQLTAITSLDEQTIRTVQPTLLLLKKQGVERLLEELKRRGQVPLLHEEE